MIDDAECTISKRPVNPFLAQQDNRSKLRMEGEAILGERRVRSSVSVRFWPSRRM
jgi:hypothetical protein